MVTVKPFGDVSAPSATAQATSLSGLIRNPVNCVPEWSTGESNRGNDALTGYPDIAALVGIDPVAGRAI